MARSDSANQRCRGSSRPSDLFRHWIVVRVQHPAWFLREIDARRAENVDQLVQAGAGALRSMNAWRWNHRDGRRADASVIVVEPCRQIRGPGEANVVYVLALQHQRALLEVVVAVG